MWTNTARGKVTASSPANAGGGRCSSVRLAAELYRREHGKPPANAGAIDRGLYHGLARGGKARRSDSGRARLNAHQEVGDDVSWASSRRSSSSPGCASCCRLWPAKRCTAAEGSERSASVTTAASTQRPTGSVT